MIGICPDIATRQIVATSGLVACRLARTMPKPQAHKSGVVVPFRAPAATPSTPLLNKFTARVSRAKTADAILDGLDEFASTLLPVNVLGVGRMPQRTSDWRSPKITARELAVLRLVSLGMASNETGTLLGIGEETVRSHLKKVQARLGARNRAHAAAEAIRQQLIP